MARLLILFLFFPLTSSAQKPLPRFENDTLYTTTGFKIYKGQSLQFGESVRKERTYKYINIKSNRTSSTLAGRKFKVKVLKDFGVSQMNNSYVEMVGSVPFGNTKSFGVLMRIAIDSAIRFAELVVPDDDRFLYDFQISASKKNIPRFESDTVFTLCGFKFFRGQELTMGNASGKKGVFKHISIEDGATNASISNSIITVKELCCFGVDEFNTASVKIFAGIIYNDGTQGIIHMRMAFDNAIASLELIVPKEYWKKPE